MQALGKLIFGWLLDYVVGRLTKYFKKLKAEREAKKASKQKGDEAAKKLEEANTTEEKREAARDLADNSF